MWLVWVVYTTVHLTRKQTPHSHKQDNRNENFGYMTSNESIDFCVSHTQYKRVKKNTTGCFHERNIQCQFGRASSKKFSVEKKKAVHELGRVYRSGTLVIKGKPPSFFLTEVTYVCHHLITVFKGCMIHHNQMLWSKLGKNFVIRVNLAKTLARTIRRQFDAQHWLLFRAY